MTHHPVKTRKILSLPLLATLLLTPATPLLAEPADRYDFTARSTTVEALLKAQQRLAESQGTTISSDPAAALFKEAQQLHQQGEREAAYARLDEAYQLARIAVRALAERPSTSGAQSTTPSDTPTTDERRIASLSTSVKALLEAYQRIAAETESSSTDAAQARVIYEHALSLKKEGRDAEALSQLKRAYTLMQKTINQLRGGQVLVKELKFDTPADEYWYEVDRLNTHMMLVKLLLDRPSLTADSRVQDAVDAAMKLSWAAQIDAAAGDYPQAITKLEQATQGLFKVILRKGFDIPG